MIKRMPRCHSALIPDLSPSGISTDLATKEIHVLKPMGILKGQGQLSRLHNTAALRIRSRICLLGRIWCWSRGWVGSRVGLRGIARRGRSMLRVGRRLLRVGPVLMCSDGGVLAKAKRHLDEAVLFALLGHDRRLQYIPAIGADLGEADGACADVVVSANVLIIDLDRDDVVVDDIDLEGLVPHGILAAI